ncbi:hypothetical protein Heshes_25830 [Alicyclobacillus hesperidum]|uniref:Uncharacterized protein n=1 Tax=Alicyclobacillus hesperidum TaxID=89784 RepID=A0AA37U735_9BACL|nr:hypothetical protein [Alicyclobacillus hesperidum]GLV14899.1 hypothetical protein Heshes_25830 [Alicyclobacillus hesperidum]
MKKSLETTINFHFYDDVSILPSQAKQVNLVATLVLRYLQSHKEAVANAEVA